MDEYRLTHLDQEGNAVMVDVGAKPATRRQAAAEGTIHISAVCLRALQEGAVKKGDVLAVARVAGIMAAKRTCELIPLCHSLQLTSVQVDFQPDEDHCCIRAICTAATTGSTGVEMEALTGVSAALLTIYDMCKALDKSMVLGGIRLLEKTGGKSGDYRAAPADSKG